MEILTVLKNDKDKYGGQSFSKKEKLEFRDFIADNSLYTLPYQGTPYTWFCKKGGECLCEKLDKVLTNSVWLSKFRPVELTHLERAFSNHSSSYCNLLKNLGIILPLSGSKECGQIIHNFGN